MGRISKYENVVRCVLMQKAATRSDDKLLYYWVLRMEGFSTDIALGNFLLSGIYPNYDSISRVRRKLQEKYPELRPPKNDQIRRQEAEEDFIEYARE